MRQLELTRSADGGFWLNNTIDILVLQTDFKRWQAVFCAGDPKCPWADGL